MKKAALSHEGTVQHPETSVSYERNDRHRTQLQPAVKKTTRFISTGLRFTPELTDLTGNTLSFLLSHTGRLFT